MLAAFLLTGSSSSDLKGCRDRKTEGLTRFAQLVAGAIRLLSFRVGKIPRSAGREHLARDQVFTLILPLQAQWVERIVDAERSIDDGHDDLQLGAGRHARNKVGARQRPNVLIELDLHTALAGAVVVDRASV